MASDAARGRLGVCLRVILAVALLAMGSRAQAEVANFVTHPEPRALPEVAFQDGEGKAQTLAAFKGKVVLLNLWATWCAPCRHEMPTLSRLQERLGGPEFEVVALSIDRAGPKVVRAFYAELGVDNLALYIDSSMKAMRALAAIGLPTTLLLDRQGREVGRLVGPAEWDSPEAVALVQRWIGAGGGPPAKPARSQEEKQ
jgi:thiol-disulfide isomerase/thioredoxin